MSKLLLAIAAAALLAGPALAQTATKPSAPRVSAPARGKAAPARSRSPGGPLDSGPYTPEANGAYQGGGVILQGAPGAPAPQPMATPPGQAPRNMVPAREEQSAFIVSRSWRRRGEQSP